MIWPFTLYTRIRKLESQTQTLRVQLDCALAERDQAREDLREVVAKVAVVYDSSSSLISKDAYVRMVPGGRA